MEAKLVPLLARIGYVGYRDSCNRSHNDERSPAGVAIALHVLTGFRGSDRAVAIAVGMNGAVLLHSSDSVTPCAILGFLFAPRIRDLPSKRLYAFDPAAAPATLRPMIARKVDRI